MNSLRRFAILSAAIVLLSLASAAQDDPNLEQGLKAYGAYHGGNIDVVSLTNGNLMVNIPLASYPQRGKLSLEYVILYNNKSWGVKSIHNQFGPTLQWDFRPVGNVGIVLTSILNAGRRLFCRPTDPDCNTPLFNTTAGTWDGSIHQMGSTSATSYESIDGTGIRFDVGQGTTDSSGIRRGTLPIEDANGNQMGVLGSNAVDTLGRVWPSFTPTDISGCPSGTVSAVSWAFTSPGGAAMPIKLCTSPYSFHTAFGLPSILEASGTTNLTSAIILPTTPPTSYLFTYNEYLDLASITLPTGGTISYDWQTITLCTTSSAEGKSRAVHTRTVNPNDGTTPSTWTYSFGPIDANLNMTNVVTDPQFNDTVHVVSGLAGSCSFFETKLQSYQGSSTSGTLLKTVVTEYANAARNPFFTEGGADSAINAVPTRITTIWPDGNVSRVARQYDQGSTFYDENAGPGITYPLIYGNVVQEDSFDFALNTPGVTDPNLVTPGPLLRRVVSTYKWQLNANYKTFNLLNLPASVVIQDGSGNRRAETDYQYDEFNLAPSGVTTQYNPSPINGTFRGNVTTVSRWLDTTNTLLSTTNTYFDTGMLATTTDPGLHQTQFTYGCGFSSLQCFAGAYVTQTKNAKNQPTDFDYDFTTGLPTATRDPNGQVTSTDYESMWRMFHRRAADGGLVTWNYTDSQPPRFTATKNITATLNYSLEADLDGLARLFKAQVLTDPEGIDIKDLTYDPLGRAATSSNPHRAISAPTDGVTATKYDTLGRVTMVVPPDGAFINSGQDCTNCVKTSYGSNVSTVTDQAGKQRRSYSDALSRVLRVDEPGDIFPGVQASGNLTIGGTLRNAVTGGQNPVPASAIIHMTGEPGFCDVGYVFMSAGSVSTPGITYACGFTAQQMAQALISNFSSTQVTATFQAGSGPDDCFITFTAVQAGSSGNTIPFSFSYQTLVGGFPAPYTFSPNSGNLSGGLDGSGGTTTWDQGTVTVIIGSFTASAPYSQTGNSSAAAVAAALVDPTNPNSLTRAGSPVVNVSVPPGSSTITMTYITPGEAGNVLVSAASSPSNPALFPGGSFSGSTTLGGGQNPEGPSLDHPYTTLYAYDTLDHLTCVEQHGNVTGTGCSASPASDVNSPWRVRRFTYDSVSRLTASSIPESGNSTARVNTTYAYDPDGNLISKTSAAPNQTGTATVTASYCYEQLHRMTSKAYTSQACPMASPVASYSYDQTSFNGLTITNGIGRRTGMTDQAGAEAWSYDPVGRPKIDRRTTNGVTKTTTYTYNFDGSQATITNPSGRIITYTYSGAARALTAKDTANSINYATAGLYSPPGGLSSLKNGTNLTSTLFYNSRLQPCRISVTTLAGTPLNCADNTQVGNILDFTYAFNFGSSNNGDATQIANNRDVTRTQTFTYDPLNRIATAQTNSTTGTKCWGETFGYDPWGDLLTIGGILGYSACTQENLAVIASVKNQVGSNTYDSAGNLISVSSPSASYTYDAENHLLTAAGVTYTYDGDGKRVKKSNGKLYWYGMGHEALDETDLTGSVTNSAFNEYVFFNGKRIARRTSSNTIFYNFTDHLGTSRVIVQAGQTTPCYDADFFPFGGEKAVTNTCAPTRKFTDKERDGESGLDNFGARYYSNAVGRFNSVDSGAYVVQDPETLNRYTYARNNPLKYIDPSGKYFVVTSDMQVAVQQWISTMLRSADGRALVQSIAADRHPTFISQGKLTPPHVNSRGNWEITSGTTEINHQAAARGIVSGIGSTQVTMDAGNAAFAGVKTHMSFFHSILKAFAHELNHVNDINKHSDTLQHAAAAGAAGDQPSQAGGADTNGGTAEAGAVKILGQVGPAADNFVPDAKTDSEAQAMIDSGMQQFQQDMQDAINGIFNDILGLSPLQGGRGHIR